MECKATKEEVIEAQLERDSIEEEVLGVKGVQLRNILGAVATLVVCATTLWNSYTTHYSVTNGHGWPSDTSMIVMNIGVVLIAWTFHRSNVIINSLLKVEGVSDRLRRKAADVIRPGPSQNNRNDQANRHNG